MMEQRVTFVAEQAGERIDKLISDRLSDLTRSAVQKLISEGNVEINGRKISKSTKAQLGDEISVMIPAPKELDIEAENIPLDIAYEDDDLLVVNKPKGMVVHPAPGNYSGTLVNALMYHCKASLSGINGVLRPGIVHRIDKDTSGLIIVAKNDFSHLKLAEQIKEHSFRREYNAVVYGKLKEKTGTIDAPIARSPKDRKKMAVIASPSSREAVTHYEVTAEYSGRNNAFSEIIARLETGRTHQIRVHMAYIAHPVAGDAVYGPKKVITSLNGQCLHAGLIGFIHPRTNEYIEIKSDKPEYFTKFLASLTEV